MAVVDLHNGDVVSWSGLFIDYIHAIKPLIYKFPLTLQCSLSHCFPPPPSLPHYQRVLRYTALFIKRMGGPTSYSLEHAFLFPDLKSSLLFLGCWLFFRMPFLAPGMVAPRPSYSCSLCTMGYCIFTVPLDADRWDVKLKNTADATWTAMLISCWLNHFFSSFFRLNQLARPQSSVRVWPGR